MSNQPNSKHNDSLKGKGRGGSNPPQGNGKPSNPKVATTQPAGRGAYPTHSPSYMLTPTITGCRTHVSLECVRVNAACCVH